MDALFDWASTTNIFYCRTIFTVQARNCVPVRARTGQFAPVASLRSALHSYRTFTTRGLYLIDRCSFDSVVLQVYPMRNYHFRHAGVLFPATFVQNAGYKASL